MNYKTINQLEKKRLKLYKQMIELDKKMDTCSIDELCNIQFEFGVKYRKLIVIEKIIKSRCPNIKEQLNYKEPINYKKLTKVK